MVVEVKPVHKKVLIVGIAVIAVASIPIAIFLTLPRPMFNVVIHPIDPADLGVTEWLEDFEYFYNYIEGNYPFLSVKERTHGYNWLDLKSMFETRISNAQSNAEFLEIIASACMALQNRHTWIVSPSQVGFNVNDFADRYPLNLVFTEAVGTASAYWQPIHSDYQTSQYNWKYDAEIVYDRGVYLLQDYNTTLHTLYGNNINVTKVDNVPIDTAIDTCYDKDYIDYDFHRSKRYLMAIYPRHFGADAVFTIRNLTGHEADIKFTVEAGTAGVPYTYPTSVVEFDIYESESVGYFYIGSFGPGVDYYYDDVLNFYSQIENYDHLIIDIRGNTGGYYSKWIEGIVRPLIQSEIVHIQHFAYRTDPYVQFMQAYQLTETIPKTEFSYLPPEVLTDDFQIHRNLMTYSPLGEFNFNGEITILTDSVVYSAAEGFTNFCKDYDFATIYGTPTGGDGIIIFPLYFVLPNSKLVVSSASACGLDGSGHCNEEVKTMPDVYYESALNNWTELIEYAIADLTGS
jgi:hypothetical protein